METYVRVLLVEEEPDTISMVSLFLSEIKECQLTICSSGEEALLKIPDIKPDLILFAHGVQGKETLAFINEVHHKNSSIFLIISLPAKDTNLADGFRLAGATECLLKDANYVLNLVNAVKKALIEISEREAFELPPLTRADQVVMDEHLPEVVFSLHLDGKVLYVNRAISSLLGYEPKDVLNRPFVELVEKGEARSAFETFLNHADSEITFRGVLPMKTSLGIEEDFKVDCTLMEGETIYGVARKLSITEGFEEQGEIKEEVIEESASVLRESLSASDALPARLGPYRIVTLLGAGAMGRVYKGFDEQLERHVAIKVLRQTRAVDEEYVERFRREAKILASINHPNIALIFYFESSEGSAFFCMEYLPGGSIEELLREKGILDPETAISYTMQVALGLKEALDKGVLHLDIKPSNLMLAENNRVKIVDFGLAHSQRDSHALQERMVGTPLYIAPEQVIGGNIDFHCDIYSLGITFFEMLYGFVPFTGTSIQEIFAKKLREDLPPRDQLNPAVPAPLYELIRQMTARLPVDRIGDYHELVEQLEQARRSLSEPVGPGEASQSVDAILMRGSLYDQPFAEVLGEIWQKKLTGRLTLSWIDLFKHIHFREGKITAVLSSQEGERFSDLIRDFLPENKALWKEQKASSDLFASYSSVMENVPSQNRDTLTQKVEQLGWRILEGLFSWITGEFFFEKGDFPGQMRLHWDIDQVVQRAARKLLPYANIRRALFEGKCRIRLNPDFQKLDRNLDLPPNERFLLFRFENEISFGNLFRASGIKEEDFFRLLYFLKCMGLITVGFEEEAEAPAPAAVAPPVSGTVAPPQQKPAMKPALAKEMAHQTPLLEQPTRSQIDPGIYYVNCAAKSWRDKNYWAVVEYCKKALEYRQDYRIYKLMGKALATHPGFLHEAMNSFKKALEIDPENPEIEREIAEVHYAAGNYALAKAKYQTVLKLDPTNEHAKARMAELSKKKKK